MDFVALVDQAIVLLTEKILTSRSALEGERKQVIVLFADLKGSMDVRFWLPQVEASLREVAAA